MSDTTVTLTHDGVSVDTTVEEMKAVTDTLAGMPDRQPHIIKKVTGVISEGFSSSLPEVGDVKDLHLTVEVASVTKRRDKDGDIEYVVTHKVVD